MKPRHPPARAQRGISLIVSLVLLVLVTLIAVGSMRGVLLQTRMSGTTHDRSLAFQASEVALREAERRAATATEADIPAAGCAAGYCATPALADTPRWMDAAFVGWQPAAAAVPADAPAPEAIVEDMGDAPNWVGCENEIPRQPNCSTRRYRISARSAADGRASVLVQSQFAAP
ncbi:MAG: PilX N-terminal domain-containing pilus assembly protein [Rubrivivax sp.]|nr:PilX N-terminal domain-containing pilus assembly protein [Rubrivivax sp.]